MVSTDNPLIILTAAEQPSRFLIIITALLTRNAYFYTTRRGQSNPKGDHATIGTKIAGRSTLPRPFSVRRAGRLGSCAGLNLAMSR